MNWSLLN